MESTIINLSVRRKRKERSELGIERGLPLFMKGTLIAAELPSRLLELQHSRLPDGLESECLFHLPPLKSDYLEMGAPVGREKSGRTGHRTRNSLNLVRVRYCYAIQPVREIIINSHGASISCCEE